MHKAVGESVLPQSFFKTFSFTKKNAVREVVFKKKNFNCEAELCQTGP